VRRSRSPEVCRLLGKEDGEVGVAEILLKFELEACGNSGDGFFAKSVFFSIEDFEFIHEGDKSWVRKVICDESSRFWEGGFVGF